MPVDLNTIDYLAFEGGGGMGLAYVGTLAALRDVYQDSKISLIDERGCFRWPVKGVSGASAGAINALMMVLDYSPQETSDLVVRDGLFARLFSEKIKLEYHRAVASGADRAKSGWYGNDKKYKRNKGDVENLNTLFDSCCSKKNNKDEEDESSFETDKNPGVYKSIRGILKSLDKGDGPMLAVMARDILKKFGIPLVHDDLVNKFSAVLWSAIGKYISGSEVGSDAENVERFARLLNEAATEELRKTVPSWTIGKSDASGMAFWGLLLTYPAALLLIILYFVLIKKKIRENQSADVIQNRSDLGRDQDKTRRVVGRASPPYAVALIFRIWWHNILTIENIINLKGMIVRVNIPNKIWSLYKILSSDEVDKKNEEITKVLAKLQEDGLKMVKMLFLAPFTKSMLSALGREGGLLQGDVTRDILTTVVFNKYYVTPVGTGSDWKLVKRREALLTTLGRFEDDSLDLATLAQAVTQSTAQTPDEAQPATPIGRKARKSAKKNGKDIRDKLFASIEEYDGLKQALAEKLKEPAPAGGSDTQDEFTSLAQLNEKIILLKVEAKLEDVRVEQKPMKVAEQLWKVKNLLDFEKLFEATGKDLVVTGTNISSSVPVFFRVALTPDFPVLDAVSMSASFPFLFRSTAVCYHGNPKVARDKDFYKRNYSGYFLDGGIFNNLPMNAFNGDQADQRAGDAISSPQEVLFREFKCNVLAFELTNEAAEHRCVFDGGYAGGKKERNLKAVLTKGLMGSFYAMGGPLRLAQPGMAELVVKVVPGNHGLFDMVPDYPALVDMFGHNYEAGYKFLAGKPPQKDGREVVEQTMGAFAKADSDRRSERREARRARRAWNRARSIRKKLVGELVQ